MPLPERSTVRTTSLSLTLRHNDHCKRLTDPSSSNIYHLEAYLPFSEAVKLPLGNANVRPASEKKEPVKEMLKTLEHSPESFHLKNRGITYLAEKFEFDNSRKSLTVTVPYVDDDADAELVPKFGIADGGHTHLVIRKYIEAGESNDGETSDPFVRVHFVSGVRDQIVTDADMVDALNTSTQVRSYTLEEYQGEFDEIKEALRKADFDLNLVAFRENEEGKEWHILEILQRMACFLRERWQVTQPVQVYKSKGKALEMYQSDRDEFRKLYGIIRDIITLPDYIESQLSSSDQVQKRSLSQLKCVKVLKKPKRRPGTSFETMHELDLAGTLPISAAFRELLILKGNKYAWRVDHKKLFNTCIEQLYQVLANKSKQSRSVSALGSDQEYWVQCVPIVLRAKDKMLEEQYA